MLPEGTELGVLKDVETYLYYEGPQLFSVEDENGQKYLVVLSDENDAMNESLFLYVPVSEARLGEIISGRMMLKDAWDKSESGFVYKVYLRPSHDSAEKIPCNSIPPAWLPDPGIKLFPQGNEP